MTGWLRRLLTVPMVVVVELALLVTSPGWLLLAGIVGLLTRSSRPVRSVVLVAAYGAAQLAVLVRLGWLRRPGRSTADRERDLAALLRWVLSVADGLLRRVLDVRLELEPGSAAAVDVAATDGIVVLARHCGPGDSLLISWLLVVDHGLSLRLVLKRQLRVEPAIDLAGDLLPFCFVGGDPAATRAGIARLSAAMRRGDALLLFPEGGNFSWERWRDAVRRLTAAGQFRRARRARRQTHTLPPRLGGALAALSAAPGASVLLLAHSGLGRDGRDRPWWRLPVHERMVVRTVLLAPAEVPRTEETLGPWLDRAWERVDTWVDGHAALAELRGEG